MIRGTPGLRLPLEDGQSRRPACFCAHCAGELYPGETGYVWEGRQICPDCFRLEVNRWLEEAAREVAWALGVETRDV